MTKGDTMEPMTVELTDNERSLLMTALTEWGGAAHPDDFIARALGFENLDRMDAERDRLFSALHRYQAMTPKDWRTVLLCAEIGSVSVVYGAGWDWETVSGFDDETTIRVLRSLQEKLLPVSSRA